MSDFANVILQSNRDVLCRSAREAIDGGICDPVIIIADLRDRVGAMFAEQEGQTMKQIAETIREYGAKGTVPTVICGTPMVIFRKLYTAMHNKPCKLPRADPGTFYAAVITGGRTKVAVLPIPVNLNPSSN